MRSALRDRPDLTAAQLSRTRALMDQHATGALVEGYQDIISTLILPDPGDRHVLAAGSVGGATLLVTFNTRDFPKPILDAHEIGLIEPDAFIEQLIMAEPTGVIAAANAILRRLRNPPMSAVDYLDSLARNGLVRTSALLRGPL